MINSRSRIIRFILFNLRPGVWIYRIQNNFHKLYCSFKNIEYKRLADASVEKHLIGIYNTKILPEEFAARYGHREMCNSADEYHYRNKKFQEWIYKYLAVLKDSNIKLADLRKKYLNSEEILKIEEEINDYKNI